MLDWPLMGAALAQMSQDEKQQSRKLLKREKSKSIRYDNNLMVKNAIAKNAIYQEFLKKNVKKINMTTMAL